MRWVRPFWGRDFLTGDESSLPNVRSFPILIPLGGAEKRSFSSIRYGKHRCLPFFKYQKNDHHVYIFLWHPKMVAGWSCWLMAGSSFSRCGGLWQCWRLLYAHRRSSEPELWKIDVEVYLLGQKLGGLSERVSHCVPSLLDTINYTTMYC